MAPFCKKLHWTSSLCCHVHRPYIFTFRSRLLKVLFMSVLICSCCLSPQTYQICLSVYWISGWRNLYCSLNEYAISVIWKVYRKKKRKESPEYVPCFWYIWQCVHFLEHYIKVVQSLCWYLVSLCFLQNERLLFNRLETWWFRCWLL